ncbi:MAG: hypothetical protein H0V43_01000 [Gemmatimonadales bacterium]|nr:hypothetical protein [Gemmatimonadales bacterium]
MRRVPVAAIGLSTLLLCGCAALARSSPGERAAFEEDCSFRSAATCWTLASRLPARPLDSLAPEPEEVREPPPPVLASGADSSGVASADY